MAAAASAGRSSGGGAKGQDTRSVVPVCGGSGQAIAQVGHQVYTLHCKRLTVVLALAHAHDALAQVGMRLSGQVVTVFVLSMAQVLQLQES